MYLRHDGQTPIFVPEDGHRTRVSMMEAVRDADPTKLKRGVCLVDLPERVHCLIIEFFSGKLERCHKSEKILIRYFLTKVNATRANGNPDSVYLSIRRGQKPMTYDIFAKIRGVGCVETLPRLNLDATDALNRIFREAMPKHVATVPSYMPTVSSDEPKRNKVVPKSGITLVPARPLAP
jgi:hypothetical protein